MYKHAFSLDTKNFLAKEVARQEKVREEIEFIGDMLCDVANDSMTSECIAECEQCIRQLQDMSSMLYDMQDMLENVSEMLYSISRNY